MGHTFSASSEIEQLMVEASRLELDTTSFTKMKFDFPTSVDVHDIPWNKAWDKLVREAVNEARLHLKWGDTTSGPNGVRAVELRSGGVRTPVGHQSLIIPLTMHGQSDKVVFLPKRDKTDQKDDVKINTGDLEEWKLALYLFSDQEKIHTLRNPIRFIWVRLPKPWRELLLE